MSRAGARSLAPHPGNLSDDMLRALAEKGGVVHICLDPRFLVYEPSAGGRRATLDDFMAHVDHVRKLIGTEHIGISTGFDGGGDVAGRRAAAKTLERRIHVYLKQPKLLFGMRSPGSGIRSCEDGDRQGKTR